MEIDLVKMDTYTTINTNTDTDINIHLNISANDAKTIEYFYENSHVESDNESDKTYSQSKIYSEIITNCN